MNDSIFEKLFPFQEPRNNQREVIEKIIQSYENGKKYVILNAPTGSGKSAIGLTVARYYTCSYFLTSQKVLQEQYYKDFKIPYVLIDTEDKNEEEVYNEVNNILLDYKKTFAIKKRTK